MSAETVEPVLAASDCKQRLPAWGVTREFRFGQFVQLFDERIVGGKRQVTPIRLSSDGDITELVESQSPVAPTAGPPPPTSMPLQLVAAGNIDDAAAGELATTVAVTDVEGLVRAGTVRLDGAEVDVELAPQTIATLRDGRPALAMAYPRGEAPTVIQLAPQMEELTIRGAALDEALAARQIQARAGVVRLDDASMQRLIQTGELAAPAWNRDTPGALVKVTVASDADGDGLPAADKIAISDVVEFISAPVIPATDGRSLEVPMDAEKVKALRRGERITVRVGDREVTLARRGAGPDPAGPEFVDIGAAYVLDERYTKYDLRHARRDLYGTLTATTNDVGVVTGEQSGDAPGASTKPKPPVLSRSGPAVAVMLPWKQTWTLGGLSRGNLLSSLALAPGEETQITVSSWERRAKALQQTAETETEQLFDYTSTTRDTEDVFREMVQSNEFDAQAHASLDASYSTGVATIQLGVGGSVANTESLVATTRVSTEHVRESTSRASTRVRARRITTISESIERTTATETIRTIRNPNACHTLTLNFHEVLAHYSVRMEFNRPAVRVVVLVPNPHPVKAFDELTVRVNEGALRSGLLDAALVDGFDACRLLKAYAMAEEEIRRLSNAAKHEREQERQREKKNAAGQGAAGVGGDKPENPQLKPLVATVLELRSRYAAFKTADVVKALVAIAGWGWPNVEELASANRWLWKRLVSAKFGTGLLDALDGIPAAPGPDDARRLVGAMPGAGGFPTLDGLGGLPDKDKEDAGLFSSIASNKEWTAAWWWWYPRLKDGRLYDVVDGGIPGLLTDLRRLLQSYDAKASEGDGMQQAAAALEQAKNEQQQATVADRLEMKFGAEVIGAAFERSQALLAHLNDHVDYYRYVLFQAMPPSEQLRRLMDSAPQLRIGMFEPHVVASDGPNLAVPLTPLAETDLAKTVKNLSDVLEEASKLAQAAGDRILEEKMILTTPGVSVESWRGDCSGCDDHAEAMRDAAVRRAEAEAALLELEAERLKARLAHNPPLLDGDEPAVNTPSP